MPIDEAGALAAMNAGLAEAGTTETAPAAEPAPAEGDDHAGLSDSGADAPADDAGQPPVAAGGDSEGAPSGDEPAEPGVAADGATPDADAPGDTPAPAVDEKPASPVDGDGKPVKVPDPLNDPLPNALKRETKERINTLIGMVKENSTKLERATKQNTELLGMIQETGASPEQYSQALDYLRMVNSPNVADREQAFGFLQQELAAMARMLGKPVPGVNMLEGHQDLIDELSTGRITPERAQEIAAAREARKFDQQRQQVTTERQRATQRQQEAVAEGRNALNAIGRQLKARDGAVYETKRTVLVKSLAPVFARIPPADWAATFQRAYDELPAHAFAPPPPPVPRVPTPAGNTPLRATNPAGGAVQQPKSALEALEMGLASMR